MSRQRLARDVLTSHLRVGDDLRVIAIQKRNLARWFVPTAMCTSAKVVIARVVKVNRQSLVIEVPST